MTKSNAVLLFDLGNVLLLFSHERMYRQMGAVLGVPPEQVSALLARDRLQWRYEAGEVGTAELEAACRSIATRGFGATELLAAASDIFEEHAPMVAMLRELKARGHRLAILSNTSPAHMEWAEPRFGLFQLFDVRIYSYAIQAMKPDRRFFELSLARVGARPDQCFFTDDLAANVEGALAAGIDAEIFTTPERCREALVRRRLLET